MKRFITSNPFLYTAGIVFVFLVWLLITLTQGGINSLVFPSPFATFAKTGELFSNEYIYRCILGTVGRTAQGFLVSFALALVLGSLVGSFKSFQTFLKPLMLVLKSAPTAIFVFLFLVISGTSMTPVWIVSFLAFPILYESVVAGFNAVPEQSLWAAHIDGSPRVKTILRIQLPLSIPYIALGVLTSFALSFKTSIMAEIISGLTKPGLGTAIRVYRADNPVDLTPIFAVALIAITIVLLVDLATYFVRKRFASLAN